MPSPVSRNSWCMTSLCVAARATGTTRARRRRRARGQARAHVAARLADPGRAHAARLPAHAHRAIGPADRARRVGDEHVGAALVHDRGELLALAVQHAHLAVEPAEQPVLLVRLRARLGGVRHARECLCDELRRAVHAAMQRGAAAIMRAAASARWRRPCVRPRSVSTRRRDPPRRDAGPRAPCVAVRPAPANAVATRAGASRPWLRGTSSRTPPRPRRCARPQRAANRTGRRAARRPRSGCRRSSRP